MRRAAKTDANQQAIVERLRACYMAVEVIGKPLDLLVVHKGETMLVECKTEEGRLTKAQVEFIARWPGKVHIVRTPDEAVAAVLGKEVMA